MNNQADLEAAVRCAAIYNLPDTAFSRAFQDDDDRSASTEACADFLLFADTYKRIAIGILQLSKDATFTKAVKAVKEIVEHDRMLASQDELTCN